MKLFVTSAILLVFVLFIYFQEKEEIVMASIIEGCTTDEIVNKLSGKLKQDITKSKKYGNATKIEPHNIFIGSIWNAIDTEFIKASNITHIFHFASGKPGLVIKPNIVDIYRETLRYRSEDVSAQFSILQNATAKIHNAISENNIILVHCMRGRSRSVSVVIAYLMEYHNLSYADARELIASQRPAIGPHKGLIAQLQQFEVFLKERK